MNERLLAIRDELRLQADAINQLLARAELELLRDGLPASAAGPITDHERFAVTWRGREVKLKRLSFAVWSCLASRAGRYVPAQTLLDEAWSGATVGDGTVKTAVWRLRGELQAGGLCELADSIDGATSGHYALLLPPGGENVTAT